MYEKLDYCGSRILHLSAFKTDIHMHTHTCRTSVMVNSLSVGWAGHLALWLARCVTTRHDRVWSHATTECRVDSWQAWEMHNVCVWRVCCQLRMSCCCWRRCTFCFADTSFLFIITFCVRCGRRKMCIGHTRLCVSLSVPGGIPTLLQGPRCNLGEW